MLAAGKPTRIQLISTSIKDKQFCIISDSFNNDEKMQQLDFHQLIRTP